MNGYIKAAATIAAASSIVTVALLWIHKHDMERYTAAGYPAIQTISGIRLSVDSLRAQMWIGKQERTAISANLDSLASEVEQLKQEAHE